MVMVLPDKAMTKTAAGAIGLPPEEAGGGGQSASAQHGTVPFGAFLRQVALWALWLWAVGGAAQVFSDSTWLGSAAGSAARRGSAQTGAARSMSGLCPALGQR